MAFKLSQQEEKLFNNSNRLPAEKRLIAPIGRHRRLSSLLGRAHLLASSALLITILSIAITIVPSNSNPLNISPLIQQVAKPFLARRDTSINNSSSFSSSGMKMKFKTNNTTPNPTASSSTTSLSRNFQQKRPIVGGIPTNFAGPLKLFKATSVATTTTNKNDGSISSQTAFPETLSALGSTTAGNNGSNRLATPIPESSRPVNGSDLNNNSPSNMASMNDINNNTIQTSPLLDNQNYNRNVNSVNGTIDLSLYANSDVDRLYGDALLVYLKNFNETLPARKETINLNGTLVPTYSSSSRVARRIRRWE